MIYRRRRMGLLASLAIVIYIGYSLLGSTPIFKVETDYPTKTRYISQVETIGYMIFDEEVYTASGDGVVEYEVSEGIRVPKDETVATLSLTEDVTQLKDELLKVQSALEYKNQSLNPSNEKYTISDKEINLIRSIQEAVNQKDIEKSLMAIETLELNTKKNVDISQIGDLINLSNQQLEDMREDLSRKIGTNNVVYKAAKSGIVSMEVDGLEDQLRVESIEDLTAEQIRELADHDPYQVTSTVTKGSPLYKIIDNYQYYMAMELETNNYLVDLEPGDSIKLAVGSIEIPAVVEYIDVGEQDGVLVIRSQEKLIDLGYGRTHNVDLIMEENDAYLLPTTSIVDQKGIPGVYIRELNGLVRYVPVDIIYQKDNNTLVSIGDDSGQILLDNDKTVQTITIYDQIIIEPGNIQEGQVI